MNIEGLLQELKVGGEDNIVVSVSSKGTRTVFVAYDPAAGQYVAFIRSATGARTVLLEGEWPVVPA